MLKATILHVDVTQPLGVNIFPFYHRVKPGSGPEYSARVYIVGALPVDDNRRHRDRSRKWLLRVSHLDDVIIVGNKREKKMANCLLEKY